MKKKKNSQQFLFNIKIKVNLWLIDLEVSKTEGRVGQTTNMVIGGTVTDDSTNEWLTLDQKVKGFVLFCLHFMASCVHHYATTEGVFVL